MTTPSTFLMLDAPALRPETVTLINAMTTAPSPSRTVVIDRLIRNANLHGWWAKTSLLNVQACHASQAGLLNWKKPSAFVGTLVNSPTFTTDRGFKGNASSMAINTNFNPSTVVGTSGHTFTLNDHGMAVYVTASSDDFGTVELGNARDWIKCSNANGKVKNGSNVEMSATGQTALGMRATQRQNSSTGYKVYKNAASFITLTDAATAFDTNNLGILARYSGSAALFDYSARQVGMTWFGQSLTDAEYALFYADIQEYMTSVGANV